MQCHRSQVCIMLTEVDFSLLLAMQNEASDAEATK